jgi:hypothetical protein
MISPFNQGRWRRVKLLNNPQQNYSLDSDKLPKKVELQLPDQVAQWLGEAAAASGRCQEELLLELLDRGLQSF